MHTIDKTALLRALHALHRAEAIAPSEDRRQFRRFNARSAAVLAADPLSMTRAGAETFGVQVRDVARGGVGLLCPDGIELRRVYRLTCVQEGVELFALPVVPRHARRIDAGIWLVGAVAVSDAASMMALGVPARDIRMSEDGSDFGPGEFSPVEAA